MKAARWLFDFGSEIFKFLTMNMTIRQFLYFSDACMMKMKHANFRVQKTNIIQYSDGFACSYIRTCIRSFLMNRLMKNCWWLCYVIFICLCKTHTNHCKKLRDHFLFVFKSVQSRPCIFSKHYVCTWAILYLFSLQSNMWFVFILIKNCNIKVGHSLVYETLTNQRAFYSFTYLQSSEFIFCFDLNHVTKSKNVTEKIEEIVLCSFHWNQGHSVWGHYQGSWPRWRFRKFATT